MQARGDRNRTRLPSVGRQQVPRACARVEGPESISWLNAGLAAEKMGFFRCKFSGLMGS